MNKKKAREFVDELNKLQEKFGFRLGANYEEDIDYDYEGNMCAIGGNIHLNITDEEGFEITIDDLMSGYSTCYYCSRNIDSDANFCNVACEHKYSKWKQGSTIKA